MCVLAGFSSLEIEVAHHAVKQIYIAAALPERGSHLDANSILDAQNAGSILRRRLRNSGHPREL